jgi:2'-5' RNA ligase
MRLFLGIEFSDAIKSEISSMLTPIKASEKWWENPHDYHLTLLFIGEFPAGNLNSITGRMIDIVSKPFVLTTSTFHFFNRRIMYLGFEHSPEVYALRKKILEVYPEFYRSHEKEFVPHMTVKRFQRYEQAELIEGLKNHPTHPIQIPVNGISLFKSEKDPENRKYHVIHRVDF